jgi:hypothetical protein
MPSPAGHWFGQCIQCLCDTERKTLKKETPGTIQLLAPAIGLAATEAVVTEMAAAEAMVAAGVAVEIECASSSS